MVEGRIPSSFRDPSGFLFKEKGVLYRQINDSFREEYDFFEESGLKDDLIQSGLLIAHTNVSDKFQKTDEAYKIIKPEPLDFISYPFEWCFSQLKDAALTTLTIQKKALEYDMSLKDASAYNIQFFHGKPVFIDTLSFERYQEGEPWIAYNQFCQHFLAPLALMSFRDLRLSQMLRVFIEGIPLEIASSLLPTRSYLNLGVTLHVHFHSRSRKRYLGGGIDSSRAKKKFSKNSFLGLINSLESVIKKLECKIDDSAWVDYYRDDSYSETAFEHKKKILEGCIKKINPKTVWDLGANTGVFSRIAGKKGASTVSFDSDPAVVEKNYVECKREGETEILPLVLDFTNPTSNIGWSCKERMSIIGRGPCDLALALALVHHLSIANNVPFKMVSEFLGEICKSLIIEFIPKEDPKVQILLSSRKDIFTEYNQQSFEKEFKKVFKIQYAEKISDSERTIYLMEKKRM